MDFEGYAENLHPQRNKPPGRGLQHSPVPCIIER